MTAPLPAPRASDILALRSPCATFIAATPSGPSAARQVGAGPQDLLALAPCELVGRKRLFSNLVEMIARDHGIAAQYAGACAQGVAQFWPADRGVRIEPEVLRRASVPTLQVLAAHELGHAWSARRLQALPLHLLGIEFAVGAAAATAASDSVAAGVASALVCAGLLVHLFRTQEKTCALIEEIRADWFALNAGCTPEQLEAAFEEAARLVDRPLTDSLSVRVKAAWRCARWRTRRGALLVVRGWLLWLPRPRRTTEPA